MVSCRVLSTEEQKHKSKGRLTLVIQKHVSALRIQEKHSKNLLLKARWTDGSGQNLCKDSRATLPGSRRALAGTTSSSQLLNHISGHTTQTQRAHSRLWTTPFLLVYEHICPPHMKMCSYSLYNGNEENKMFSKQSHSTQKQNEWPKQELKY